MNFASDYGYTSNQQACVACGSFGAEQCCDGKGNKYTAAIDWPNGDGYTPCTPEYAALMDERDAIFDAYFDEGTTEDLSPENYERWYQLDSQLRQMQMAGALGVGIRY
ncbi:MAG: hypothetical protein WC091_24075 [Sulfuricellaceae bacterium]